MFVNQHSLWRLGDVFRLMRPRGVMLLYLPCLWGLIVASGGQPRWQDLLLFLWGAFLTRSVGCAYNDWVDQDIDCHVTRTQQRPLAQKDVSLVALGCASGVMLVLALWVLVQLSMAAIYGGLLAALLVLPYPWLKRVTYWPQLYLGFLFSSGIWVAWFQVNPDFRSVTFAPFLLYGAGILWTLYYDTVYGYQDRVDDSKVGVKSTSLLWGDHPGIFFVCCLVGMMVCLVALGWSEQWGWPYFLGLGLAAGHLGWQQWNLDIREPQSCLRVFFANPWTGLWVAFCLWIGCVS